MNFARVHKLIAYFCGAAALLLAEGAFTPPLSLYVQAGILTATGLGIYKVPNEPEQPPAD